MNEFETLSERQRKHVLYTWTAQGSARPVGIQTGQGAEFTDHEGKVWLDFESQVFNCNAGHGQTRITDAMVAQAEQLACAHPAAVFERKAALGEALARVTPEGIDKFFLCLSGAEAVENAYKIARMVTGRHKVIARRRSYHGASMGALALTGDWRRMAIEPGVGGVIRMEDPYCYRCPYGLSKGKCGTRCATDLERILELEGPDTIAAVFLEGVTGANGGFVPPDDYWPIIRDICDRHGILLVSDEVFTGFGRTGEWFAVDHWSVRPDIITMAKGLTSGYAPLGAVGVTQDIADHFESNTLWCGLTSYAHPVSCAAALATIEVYEDDRLIEHAAALDSVLKEELQALLAHHSVVGDVRSIGLLGAMELVTDKTSNTPLVPYGKSAPEGSAIATFPAELKKRGLHILVRGHMLIVAPPLCITEAQLRDGMRRIGDALAAAFN